MDSLYIQDLEVWTRIGVPDDERAVEQRVRISIELFTDLLPASKSDDVSKSIDYALVASDIRTASGTVRKTLERFAEDIATMILKNYGPKGGVKVSIKKFVLPDAAAVSVTILRTL